MELSIRSRAFELTDELREAIAKRIQLALDTFEDRIEETFVYMVDLNGPKGGIDKLCQITVRGRGVGEIVVRETGSTIRSALNRAARRAKYRLSVALRQADRPATESIRTALASS